MAKIEVKGTEIRVVTIQEDDYISLTDGWDIRRNLTKINYRIHTDAIKENLIPLLIGHLKRIPKIRRYLNF